MSVIVLGYIPNNFRVVQRPPHKGNTISRKRSNSYFPKLLKCQ